LRGSGCLPARAPKLRGGFKPAFGALDYSAGRALPPSGRNLARRYGSCIAGAPTIEPVTGQQLELLLPLIAAYQRFYEVEQIDDERNRAFFSRFLAPSEDGMLIGAWRDEELVGYACLYWTFTSLAPAEIVLMNDLYVEPQARGEGVGRALIEASAAIARERGAQRLQWITATDNETAQRLYDSTGAERWGAIEYELEL
jgi:GNAT superfamily N-acetyltransferase